MVSIINKQRLLREQLAEPIEYTESVRRMFNRGLMKEGRDFYYSKGYAIREEDITLYRLMKLSFIYHTLFKS